MIDREEKEKLKQHNMSYFFVKIWQRSFYIHFKFYMFFFLCNNIIKVTHYVYWVLNVKFLTKEWIKMQNLRNRNF